MKWSILIHRKDLKLRVEGRKTEATYCSLAHHFGPHSHRHGRRRTVEEHTPHYDTGTDPYYSAVLKKTQPKIAKKIDLVMMSCYGWNSFFS